MGASKSKGNAPSSEEVPRKSMPESKPTKAAAADFSSKSDAKKEARTVAEPVKLPTKSWRALLEDPPPMSKDAVPFRPGAIPLPEKLLKTSSTPSKDLQEQVSAVADKDDPEWMQYLSKFAGSPHKQGPGGNAGQAGSRPQKSLSKHGGAELGNGPGGKISADGPSGGVVIHTESYLQLLKEGSAKKNKAGTSAVRRSAPTTADAENAAGRAAHKPTSPPSATSNLVQKWSSRLSKKQPEKQATVLFGESRTEEAEEQQAQTVQDDTWTAKLLFDQDLSDPAYFSDAELSVRKTSASVHRLQRRPRANKALIRSYVMQDLSFLLDQVVGMMLLRLQRFTDQQARFFPAAAHSNKAMVVQQPRRFVIGLKEVMRRTKQSKIKCLIVAPDIEEDGNSGGLDDRMRELLASAYQNQTPVIFALSRSRLGKALGKNLHISVLGILDARGAQSMLDESVSLAGQCQQTWLARLEK